MSMEINPISLNDALTTITKLQNTTINTDNQTDSNSFIPFADVLREAVENVSMTDEMIQADVLKIAAGDTDAVHNLTINMAKADLAIQTLVQIRNKALDAYNEIMRITL